MADIARETGLTLGTVSRALNEQRKYSIAPETRERVLEAANRLGFRPNFIGRALAAGSSSLVVYLSPSPFAPYYAEIGRFLSGQAARSGLTLINGGDLTGEGRLAIRASDWLYGADAIVVCDYRHTLEPYISEGLRLKIPVIELGTHRHLKGDFVGINLYAASTQLMEHMLAQGCRRIGIVSSHGTTEEDLRMKAYMDALRAHRIAPIKIWCPDHTRISGREAILEFYGNGNSVDGLFCQNDQIAVGAYRGLTELGVGVPDDVLLAGCDGLEDTLYQYVPISTIAQPLEQVCEIAWSMLRSRTENREAAGRVEEVSATFVARASTLRPR
ncbi:LacI family DNA-binding transcriptional regulator [Fimbriimonas ginsengisoli]|uniref:Transcriptional regulator, LacI family n=1 Tax=Fimbriimonas ginsengisoli Gsoil 348 TaxID=661478 RepID=A0A068NUS8_FIMGI|nr:LacI family DNA-binding transcriptional regulator [Fimbriimonas ginsengisoli]AIE86515.1 transcriptional regulator, LacI family [Fimbriimonas ginsengisoli Gsoil 348]